MRRASSAWRQHIQELEESLLARRTWHRNAGADAWGEDVVPDAVKARMVSQPGCRWKLHLDSKKKFPAGLHEAREHYSAPLVIAVILLGARSREPVSTLALRVTVLRVSPTKIEAETRETGPQTKPKSHSPSLSPSTGATANKHITRADHVFTAGTETSAEMRFCVCVHTN